MAEGNPSFARRLWTIEQRESDPWYLGYLFQGAVILGVSPILIPIIVAAHGTSREVGIVVAAFYLGQVVSPLLGRLADKTRRFGLFFLGGFLLVGAGCAGFAVSRELEWWVFFALLQGIGAGASNTTAFSYVVEFRPRQEWDARLGWLQTFYGTGQSIGLLLAAVLPAHPDFGMVLCAVLMIPGILLASRGLPRLGHRARQPGDHVHQVPVPGPARMPQAVVRHHEHLRLDRLRQFVGAFFSRFSLWIAAWFSVMMGVWLVFNFLPLLMEANYRIGAGLSSLYYGLSATVGIVFYALSGRWSERYGSSRVVFAGCAGTLLSAGGMFLLVPVDPTWQAWTVPWVFAILPVAWSPLIVGGSALTGELASGSQGTAMGIFNAAMALASVGAALLGGWLAGAFDYAIVTLVAAGFALLGLLLAIPLLAVHGREKLKAGERT